MRKVDKFKEFALLVAQGCEYETEYDGRTYTCCAYCGNGLGDGIMHDSDCAMLEAQKALGDEWIKYKTAEEKRIEEKNRYRVGEYDYTKNNQVECDICGKIVAESGLRQHKKDSHACKNAKRRKKSFEDYL